MLYGPEETDLSHTRVSEIQATKYRRATASVNRIALHHTRSQTTALHTSENLDLVYPSLMASKLSFILSLPFILPSSLTFPASPPLLETVSTLKPHVPIASSVISTTTQSNTTSTSLTTLAASPVICFSPTSFRHQTDFSPSDCRHLIITLITPPTAPTRDLKWGFKNSPNIDVQLPKGGHWTYEQCEVFVSNIDHSRVDAFSLDDVGVA
ncbi:hypothetical protein ABVK25_000833, partial [Lepraria finkii]